jgi:hypothetical protein
LIEAVNLIRYRRAFLQDGFGILRIVPETVAGDDAFDLGQPFFVVVQVKDSP